MEFTALAEQDHTCCHIHGFLVRIPAAGAKLPIIERFNKQAEKCNAFVWLGTTVEALFRTPKRESSEEIADAENMSSYWKPLGDSIPMKRSRSELL